MLSRKVLQFVNRQLQDIVHPSMKHLPFGGKVVLLGGDWKQLAPVVEQGTKEDQIFESIVLDSLFMDNFEWLR